MDELIALIKEAVAHIEGATWTVEPCPSSTETKDARDEQIDWRDRAVKLIEEKSNG